jgi:hypothetical protein
MAIKLSKVRLKLRLLNSWTCENIVPISWDYSRFEDINITETALLSFSYLEIFDERFKQRCENVRNERQLWR